MTCETAHTDEVIESGSCGDCGQMWCPSCQKAVGPAELRYEENRPGEPSWIEHGCVHCLPGRLSQRYREQEERLLDAHIDRQIDRYRERDL